MNINNRNVVITGAASGIGWELTRALFARNCRIVAADLNIERIPEHERITAIRFDAGDRSSVDELFDKAMAALGSIDIFIANAGFAYYEEYDRADWDRIDNIYRVNVLSPLYVVARMAELRPEGGYRVVVTASAMARLPMPGYAVYSSTKAALHGFAEGYRHEPKAKKRLSVVYPIATRTNFFAEAGNTVPVAFPTQSAESVAGTILRGIRRNRRRILPSPLFRLMLVVDRIFPPALMLYLMSERGKFLRWIARES